MIIVDPKYFKLLSKFHEWSKKFHYILKHWKLLINLRITVIDLENLKYF